MANDIATYLKYANLQMAAEAIPLNSGISPDDLKAALLFGNNRSSKFTETQATDFSANWTVVEHKANTATGFSGTLFKNNATNELVLSFRSTEFLDDNARDNKATNEMEIKAYGWAFGQIADMEKWYAELNADTSKLQGKSFAVTGYSLGGHLATAFGLLRQQEALTTPASSPVTATYTFKYQRDGYTDKDIIGTKSKSPTFIGDARTARKCYTKSSCLRTIYLGCSAKKHLKLSTPRVGHA